MGNLHDGTYILLNQMVWVGDYNTFTGDYMVKWKLIIRDLKKKPNDIGLIIPLR
ncbi:MAG: hypothetical protein IPI52_05525 [Bacteroidetes bacterium]|nr:hypothetical protein [Bacteroidota bacterium]